MALIFPPKPHVRRRRLGAVAPLLGLATAAAILAIEGCRDPATEPSPTIAIVGATLIDGTGRPPIDDAVVVMRDGRFECIGDRTECTVPADAVVIDHSSRWLIPGLIDTHVHLVWTVDDSAWTARAQAVRFAVGVTTVREMGTFRQGSANRAAARAATAARHPTPRIHWSGRVDAASARRHGTSNYAELAGDLIDADVDGIKVKSPIGWHAVAEVLAVAESRGVDVYGHAGHVAGSLDELELAIRHGLDGVVHTTTLGSFIRSAPDKATTSVALTGEPSKWIDEWTNIDPALATRLARAMIDSNVWLEPTLVSIHLLVYPNAAGDPEAQRYVQPSSAADLRADTLPAGLQQAGVLGLERMREFVWRFHQEGGTVVPGSDENRLPGWAFHEELYLLAKTGLTPMDVLRAATSDAARVLGWSEMLGTVERGKIADMVVLDGDPLADVRNTKRVHSVFKGGIQYEAEALGRSAARASR